MTVLAPPTPRPGLPAALGVGALAAAWTGLAFLVPGPLGPGLLLAPFLLAWILHRPTRPLTVLLLLAPFTAAGGLGGGAVANYLLPLLAVALVAADRLWTSRPVEPLPGRLGPWFLVFTAWLLVCTAASRYPADGLPVVVRYALLGGLLLAVYNGWTRRALGRTLLLTAGLLLLAALIAVREVLDVGIASYFTSRALFPDRVTGYFENPNHLGLVLGHGTILFAAYLIRPGRSARFDAWIRVALVAGILLLATGLVVSFSRASILYAGVGTGLLLLTRRRIRWLVFAGSASLLGLLLAGPLPLWLFFRLRLHTGTSYRADLWDAALHIVRDHPWVGVGPGDLTFEQFRSAYLSTAAIGHLNDTWAGGAHNVFLQNATQLGWPGLLLVGTLFAALWFRIPRALARYRGGDWLAGAAAAGVVGLTFHALFEVGSTVGPGRVAVALPFWLFALVLLAPDRAWPAERERDG